jgi:hypothetical protein
MPDSAYYLWEPPGHPAAVELSLAVADKINSLIRQTTVFIESENTGRPLETGGLLFGRHLDSGAVTVDDFDEIPSEHRRGASFTLSLQDRARLGYRLEKFAKQGRTVVGYFRIHTRPGLYLDHDDDLTIRQFFSQPWQVVLLAKPQPGAPPEAGFFFWDEGDMDRRQTALPFPLDRDALQAGGHTIVQGPPPASIVTPLPAPPRRNWVPIAGAVALFALAAVFVPTGVFTAGRTHKSAPPAPIQASIPPSPASTELPASTGLQDTWPAPDEVQKVNAAAVRRARLAHRKAPPLFVAPLHSETAVGPAPVREEIALAPPPPIHDAPPAMVLPKPKAGPHPLRPEVLMEPLHRSALYNTIGHIPLIGKLEHNRDQNKDDFVPARPRQERAPAVPLELSRELRHDEPVVLRIRIAKNGAVSETELVSRKSDPVFASIAVHAAAEWDFEPARIGNKAVPSDMLVHFRFRATH